MKVKLKAHAELACLFRFISMIKIMSYGSWAGCSALCQTQATYSCLWRLCVPVAGGGPPGGQKCDLIWHYTWGWECNVPTKLQPVASLCLCHPLRHNHTSNAMWQEHDYQTSKWFAALWQQQQTKDEQSIDITEYSYCGGVNWIWGYSHV